MTVGAADTVWQHGRFDARDGPGKVLFGRVYEDASIEQQAFRAGARVVCIASAGCTAMALAPGREVLAVDINPVQLAYAQRRFAGEPAVRGAAERVMGFGRTLGPIAGWWPSRVEAFLALDDPSEQMRYWRRHLDTWRFRTTIDGFLSLTALRAVYASPFLDLLPPRLGTVMRARMERCFARHPNRTNPYARALLLGELADAPAPPEARDIRLVNADAASFLEQERPGSVEGFALSNILDGAEAGYERRLMAAVKRAAAHDAVVVMRSFREPPPELSTNRADDDRSMLWGVVDVRSVSTIE
jgi:S-adenosylmethionine:diacylglycerol 3-amino-3-carboxypropyl transferase